jgi:hypothetical protein
MVEDACQGEESRSFDSGGEAPPALRMTKGRARG